jgi:hypothetical protein
MGDMTDIQPIVHYGELAAIVVGGQAIIPDEVPKTERVAVQAKCLYALEMASGQLPGPYTDAGAAAYARAAAAQRS